MHGSQIVHPDYILKFLPCAFVSLRCAQIITCGISMACVYTHTHTAFVLHTVYDMGDLLEAVSQIRSLPGGVLYYGSHTMRAVKSYVY